MRQPRWTPRKKPGITRWHRAPLVLLIALGLSAGCSAGSSEERPEDASSDSQTMGADALVDLDGSGEADAGSGEHDGNGHDGNGHDGNGDGGREDDGGSTPDASAPDDAGSAPVCPGGAGCPCGPEVGVGCDDGNPCIVGKLCVGGFCTPGLANDCDDGDPCTTDTCVFPTGCEHEVAVDGTACNDGDLCTSGDACQGGVCSAGPDTPCDDGNACTDDACDPVFGCVYSHNTIECSAENACVEPSFCTLGSCPTGKLKACAGDGACTYAFCDPDDGCEVLPLPDPATVCNGVSAHGRCYEAQSGEPLTWKEARAACHASGLELASVRANIENDVVRAEATAVCGEVDVWLGLSDHGREGTWRWSDGTSSNYRAWASGEPNNAGNEDYTAMTSSGVWNDLSGSAKRGCWVCARPLEVPCDDGDACMLGDVCEPGGTCLPGAVTDTCDDHNPCTADSCGQPAGCTHIATADGGDCGLGVCAGGACLQDNPLDTPPSSCLGWLEAASNAGQGPLPSAVYWLSPPGGGAPYQAWCDMATDGGGWTLVLKADGTKDTFAWGAALWADDSLLGTDAPALDGSDAHTEARLASYLHVPFTELRVGLEDEAGARRWLTLPVTGASLAAAIQPGAPVETSAGIFAWKGLLPGSSLQHHCHLEGLNASGGSHAQVRIGIVGNNEKDCATPDSWLGIGGNPKQCKDDEVRAVGNKACYYADKGNKRISAFGYVLVR